MLSIEGLRSGYTGIDVLKGISLAVPERAIIGVLGPNGAGKTALLRAISGINPVRAGRVTFAGSDLTGREPDAAVRAGVIQVPQGRMLFGAMSVRENLELGAYLQRDRALVEERLAQVMEGRRVFAELTVEENLRAGALARRDKSGIPDDYERVLGLFPTLESRTRLAAGYLSGGQQQMLAIAQALMAGPKLLLLDEPSLGLAESVVRQIRHIIVQINASGTGVLLVEQNARMALSVADHAYVLENGKVVRDGPSKELLDDRDVKEFYLGMGESGRRSFRDVKSYRRKKRWGG